MIFYRNIKQRGVYCKKWKIAISALAISLFGVNGNAADNPASSPALQTQISDLQNRIAHTHNQQSALDWQLSQAQQRLQQTTLKLQQTRRQLAEQQHVYNRLSQDKKSCQQQLQAHQSLLAQQLCAIYQLPQFSPTILLRGNNVSDQPSRLLNYYRYLQQKNLSHLQNLKQSLQQVTQHTLQISQRTQQLYRLQNAEQKNHLHWEGSRLQHQQALQLVSTEIQRQHQQLQQLVASKELSQSPAVVNEKLANADTFAVRQGKLPWPTRGTLIEHFGAPIAQSELRWTDVLIQAPEGQSVRAVANGKVVFANTMPGYGLLLIIDHGNGYMTLYGHNRSLYKKTGDTIKAGQLIAIVGRSGDSDVAALYFGIRHNSKPLNPEQWCV